MESFGSLADPGQRKKAMKARSCDESRRNKTLIPVNSKGNETQWDQETVQQPQLLDKGAKFTL
jgi:hypothetical protein